MRVVGVLIALAVVAAVAGLAFIYSGTYDVAASVPHSPVTEWVLSTTMDRSVARHAEGIVEPASLASAERVSKGFEEYDEMCVGCHGAPGVKQGEVAKGLNPEPPELEKTVPEWTPAELFWITKHGVKMTGMPAFGRSHDDEKLWNVVAFLEELPKLTPAEYQHYREMEKMEGSQEHHHEESMEGQEGSEGAGSE